MNKFVVLIGIVFVFLIHNLNGAYGDDECPSDEIDKLNTQIADALSKYPDRDGSLTLSGIYYDRYQELREIRLSAPAKQSDCNKAKKTLEMFLEIAPDFEKIIPRMEKAVDVLFNIQQDDNASMELKYNALYIKSALKYSTTIQQAESALEKYEAFKKANNIVVAPGINT